jgi:hypothetical protein
MSISDTMNDANAGRRLGGVFIFLPLLIAVLGVAAIVLSQMPDRNTSVLAGYGIDERTTGAIAVDPTTIP